MTSRTKFLEDYQVNLAFKDEALREASQATGVSVISNEIGEFVSFYLKNKKISEVVEIGSGYGYSTKFLHILLPEARIHSVERHFPRYERARDYLVSDRVEFFNMSGEDYLAGRKERIDLLFLDGSKPHYIHFLKAALPLMDRGAILLADNIFGRGLSYDEGIDKRHRTMQRRIKEFLDLAFEEFHASLLPIDDGLFIGEKL